MKTKIEVDLQPFSTPNFVVVHEHDTGKERASIALAEIDSVTLDALCREFRTAIFEKAGKEQPPIAASVCSKCERTIR